MSKTMALEINILCLWISEQTSIDHLDSIHVLDKKRSLEILGSGKRKVTKEKLLNPNLGNVYSYDELYSSDNDE